MGLLELFVEKARVKCCEVTGLDPLNCEIGNIRYSFDVFGSQDWCLHSEDSSSKTLISIDPFPITQRIKDYRAKH